MIMLTYIGKINESLVETKPSQNDKFGMWLCH